MQSAPILILGYARTENIWEMINLVNKLGKRNLYLSLDGPRNEVVANAQQKLIDDIKDSKIDIRIRRNMNNQGVAVSVISGIDWFFSREEFGIIIEDDLHFTTDFISWCEWAGEHFSGDSQVFMISGNRFMGDEVISYTHYPQTWGWATWSNRWQKLRPLYSGKPFQISNVVSYVSNFWTGGTLRILSAVTDTWDILIAKYMKENSLITVLPPRNLVSNLGADQYSTHTSLEKFPIAFPIKSLSLDSLKLAAKESSEIISNDDFLERKVFHIRYRHWFSLLKNLPLMFYRNKLSKRLLRNDSIEL